MNRTERFLTAEELGAHLRLRPSTVKTWARTGRIPARRLTQRVVRFDLEEVQRALAMTPVTQGTHREEEGHARRQRK